MCFFVKKSFPKSAKEIFLFGKNIAARDKKLIFRVGLRVLIVTVILT